MAEFDVEGGVDPILRVRLEKGESVAAESGSMVAMDKGLSLKGKMKGGFFGSLARKFLNDETFFQQWVEASDCSGEVYLSPNLPGDIRLIELRGDKGFYLSDGSFLAATDGVEVKAKSQGIGRAILGDSGGFFVMHASGRGTLAVSSFGSMREIRVSKDRPVVVDNGHLVAWDDGLEYELMINTSKSGIMGRLMHSQLSGEGIVLGFKGEGTILVSSRGRNNFLDWIFGNQKKPEMENE